MRALDEVMKNRTTFVIAHRLSTVRKASRILVFEAGRIVEAGTFDELVMAGGRFRRPRPDATHLRRADRSAGRGRVTRPA